MAITFNPIKFSSAPDLKKAETLIGKHIKWKSPSSRRVAPGKYSDEYEGIAICVLPSGNKPTVCQEIAKAKSSQCNFGNGKFGESINDRLIVRIDRNNARTGKPLQPLYYAPRISSIFASEI